MRFHGVAGGGQGGQDIITNLRPGMQTLVISEAGAGEGFQVASRGIQVAETEGGNGGKEH